MNSSRRTRGALVAAVLIAALGPTAAPASAGRYKCRKGVQFPNPPQRKFLRTEPIQRNENRSDSRVTFHFSSKRSKTVGQEISAGGKVSADAVFASAEASFNKTISKSTTAEIGNSVDVPTPGRHAAVARYGIYRYVFRGTVVGKTSTGLKPTPNCPYGFKFNVTATIPADAAGWVVKTPKL